MKLLSSYFSDDQLRTAQVFVENKTFIVECLDSASHKDFKHTFGNEVDAEEFAEDWVMQ